ncbi:MAG: tetratricopeptide repeat protein [Planctomycetaceae bacterium]
MQQSVPKKPTRRSRRRQCLRLAVLALLLGGGLAGWRTWKERRDRPQQIFDTALASVRKGDLREVDKAIEFLENEPGYASQTRVLRGAALAQRGRVSEALLELQSVSLDGDLRGPVLYWAGRCLEQQGKLVEAESAFRKLLQDEPDHAEAHRRLAGIYHGLGAMDAAVAELEHVVRLDPNDYAAYQLIGDIYHRDGGQENEAVKNYRDALDRHPPETERANIACDLAESLVALRKYREALRALPGGNNARALTLHAECEWNLNHKENARKLLQRSLQINATLRSSLIFQARLHIDDREPKKAVLLLQRILKTDPHDYPARYQLIQAYRQLGDTAAAERESTRMVESEALRKQLGTLYRRAMKDMNDVGVRRRIAELCEKLGQDRLAAIWKRAAQTAGERKE